MYGAVQALVVGCVLIGVLVPLGSLLGENMVDGAVQDLHRTAREAAPRLDRALARESPGEADEARLLAELDRVHGAGAVVRRADGTVVTSPRSPAGLVAEAKRLSPQGGTRTVTLPRGMPPGGHERIAVASALGPAGNSGTLLVEKSAVGLRGDILMAWFALAAVVPVGTALCLLPVVVLRRRAESSLERLRDTTRSLSEGAFHVRADTDAADLPAVRALARDINQLGSVIQSAIEEQRHFLADVAHQLRNPMIALRLRVENLRPHVADEEEVRISRALADVDRLDRTLTDLLEHARSVPDVPGVQIENVCGVAENCVWGWAPVAEARSVRLKLSMPSRAWAMTRIGAVEQTLNVLLANALKYAPEDSVVEVRVERVDGGLHIAVRDQGPGLSDVERKLALKRGWSRDASGGSGIGLSIATKLIESSGGRLRLRSLSQGGLEAVVCLVSALPMEDGPRGAEGADDGAARTPPAQEPPGPACPGPDSPVVCPPDATSLEEDRKSC
ncbi:MULTISPECIES: HAMP domain-containing sensor histidine kinase [unclassified Streptomyces]|uniref:sensor histidine kinase n=1 Tax=unclassified Streptomyces TaxID=2593676 RepID=UPI00332939B8